MRREGVKLMDIGTTTKQKTDMEECLPGVITNINIESKKFIIILLKKNPFNKLGISMKRKQTLIWKLPECAPTLVIPIPSTVLPFCRSSSSSSCSSSSSSSSSSSPVLKWKQKEQWWSTTVFQRKSSSSSFPILPSFLPSLILRWPCTKMKDRQLMMSKQMRECVFQLLSSTGNGWWCNSVLIGSVTRCNRSMGFMNHCVLKQAAVLHNHGERSET